MKITIVDQIVRPKVEGGCEWGNFRKVLVRLVRGGKPVKELWWMPGFTGWAGRGCTDYYHSQLMTDAEDGSGRPLGGANSELKTLHEGGRLSVKLIAKYAKQIDAFFGDSVSGLIRNTRKTMIIED